MLDSDEQKKSNDRPGFLTFISYLYLIVFIVLARKFIESLNIVWASGEIMATSWNAILIHIVQMTLLFLYLLKLKNISSDLKTWTDIVHGVFIWFILYSYIHALTNIIITGWYGLAGRAFNSTIFTVLTHAPAIGGKVFTSTIYFVLIIAPIIGFWIVIRKHLAHLEKEGKAKFEPTNILQIIILSYTLYALFLLVQISYILLAYPREYIQSLLVPAGIMLLTCLYIVKLIKLSSDLKIWTALFHPLIFFIYIYQFITSYGVEFYRNYQYHGGFGPYGFDPSIIFHFIMYCWPAILSIPLWILIKRNLAHLEKEGKAKFKAGIFNRKTTTIQKV